jgi:Zn-dependent protease
MRDPLTWSFPLGRLFGVNIRVHLLFPLVAAGLVLRAAFLKDAPQGLWIDAAILMGLLFLGVLLHELGHCFGARAVDGDATEVLLWPLGGLAFPEVPHTPRANFITAATGPAVNLFLCVLTCVALAFAGWVPSFKPWSDPYFPVVYNSHDSYYYGSKSGRGDLLKFTGFRAEDGHWVSAAEVDEKTMIDTVTHKPVRAEPVNPEDVILLPADNVKKGEASFPYGVPLDREKKKDGVPVRAEALPYAAPVVLAARFFWVNWFLLLLNLVPAFPLDGARLLQCVLWWRSDYRQGTLFAIGTGFLMMLLCLLFGIVLNEILVFGLALILYYCCRRQWIVLETGGEESLFGYDFSEGYTSLERDQPAAPPRRQPGWFQRWRQRRAETRMRREQATREAEERRMDELLEKVQRVGLQGLTDEERRFLTRVSARYRNRQE